jgi:integrase
MPTIDTLLCLVLADYVARGRRSLPTLRSRVRTLRRLLPVVPDEDGVDRYIASRRREGAAAATIRNELSVLHRAFLLARRRHLLSDQQIPSIESPRVDNVRTVTATARQVRTLVAALEVLDPSVADLVRWLVWTGWRRGEAQGLTWEDFDEDLRIVTLPSDRSKTSRIRRVALGPDVQVLVAHRWHCRRGPYVFHRGGRRIKHFHGAWSRAVAGAGCPDLRPHDLRRIFCQVAMDAGVAIPVIQQIAGWKTISMVCRYGIASGDMQARGQAAIATKLGSLG